MNSDSTSAGRFHQRLRDFCPTEIFPASTIQQLQMSGSLNIYLFICSLVIVPFPTGSRKFSFLPTVPTGSRDHQASYSIRIRGILFIYLFSSLCNASTSSCAHLTIIQRDSKRCTQFRTSIFPELYMVCE